MNVTFSTEGCLDTSYIPSDYPTQGYPIYHDPSGKCYLFNPVTNEPIFYFQYGYDPAFVTGVVFTVLFGLTAIIHFGYSLSWRPKWYLVVAIGAIGETIGWVGRTLSGKDNSASVAAGNYFLIQICCLTIAPTFFSAACYGLFAIIVSRTETSVSRLGPKALTWVFIVWDIVALVLQAIGGAMASLAKTREDSKRGTNIMVAGIVFQLVAMIVYSIMVTDFLTRLRNPLPRNLRRLVYGIAATSFLIILRGAYRTAELSQGWDGYLITHEGYFLGLDTVPMLICITVLLMIHPRYTLPIIPTENEGELKA